jgi:hypothetical protein
MSKWQQVCVETFLCTFSTQSREASDATKTSSFMQPGDAAIAMVVAPNSTLYGFDLALGLPLLIVSSFRKKKRTIRQRTERVNCIQLRQDVIVLIYH